MNCSFGLHECRLCRIRCLPTRIADSTDFVTTKITFASSNAIISTVGGVVGLDYVGGGAIGGAGAQGVGAGGLGGGGAGEGGDGAGAAAHM